MRGPGNDWRVNICLFGGGPGSRRVCQGQDMSSVRIKLHPKQTEARSQANSAEGDEVSANEEVLGQEHYYGSTPGFFLHLKSDTSWPLNTICSASNIYPTQILHLLSGLG